MFNKRKRALSKNGEDLFSVAMKKPKFFLTKKNSWDIESPIHSQKKHILSCLPKMRAEKCFRKNLIVDYKR